MNREEYDYAVAAEWLKARDFLRRTVVDARRDLGMPLVHTPLTIPPQYRRMVTRIQFQRVTLRITLIAEQFTKVGRAAEKAVVAIHEAFTGVNEKE